MRSSKIDFSKLSATMFALFSACVVSAAIAAGPSQPITTMPVPNLPTGVAVCMQPCKGAAKSMLTKVNPDGSFQITGLAVGRYEVTPPTYPMQVYAVGSNGVLNGRLTPTGPVSAAADATLRGGKPPPSDMLPTIPNQFPGERVGAPTKPKPIVGPIPDADLNARAVNATGGPTKAPIVEPLRPTPPNTTERGVDGNGQTCTQHGKPCKPGQAKPG